MCNEIQIRRLLQASPNAGIKQPTRNPRPQGVRCGWEKETKMSIKINPNGACCISKLSKAIQNRQVLPEQFRRPHNGRSGSPGIMYCDARRHTSFSSHYGLSHHLPPKNLGLEDPGIEPGIFCMADKATVSPRNGCCFLQPFLKGILKGFLPTRDLPAQLRYLIHCVFHRSSVFCFKTVASTDLFSLLIISFCFAFNLLPP